MSSASKGISIIVPVYNEATGLSSFLKIIEKRLHNKNSCEILLVDGGSTDGTQQIAEGLGFKVLRSAKGRAVQMNEGARMAGKEILYFLHADTIPPLHFDLEILNAVQSGSDAGCFRMKFDSNSSILKLSCWFTRFNLLLFRGGDQSLFIKSEIFRQLGGFDPEFIIYEDCEFIGRIYREASFKVIPRTVISSARKYRSLGTIYLQFHFGMIHLLNFMGSGPESLYRYYEKRISSRLS